MSVRQRPHVRTLAEQYFHLSCWQTTYFALVGVRKKRFDLAYANEETHKTGGLPYVRTREEPREDWFWRDEAYREKRIDYINAQSVYYERMGSNSGIKGVEKHELAMMIAAAANHSCVVPLGLILASYERLAQMRDRSPWWTEQGACGRMLAGVVIEHVYKITRPDKYRELVTQLYADDRAGRPCLIHELKDYLDENVPHSAEIFRHDFRVFVRRGVSEEERQDDKQRLLDLVDEPVNQRRLTVGMWSPPYKGVMVGAAKPFEASMLDAYAVRRKFLDRSTPVNSQLPAYQPPSRSSFSSSDGAESPFHAGTRSLHSPSPAVLDELPSFPPPSYD
ncbi:hypothetical protein JCM8547_002492 [Rhodosporidiobolus lusitaniae]